MLFKDKYFRVFVICGEDESRTALIESLKRLSTPKIKVDVMNQYLDDVHDIDKIVKLLQGNTTVVALLPLPNEYWMKTEIEMFAVKTIYEAVNLIDGKLKRLEK